jgi:hypothetical protein
MPRSLERLSDDIANLAADLQATTCRWLLLIAEFDRREGWAQEGCKSCAHWVGWRCGVGDEAAREYVRVARRLDDLPLVRDAFARGELTYSKVRALTRVEDVSRESELVGLARATTAAQLERTVRAYRRVVASEEDPAEREARRYLDWSVGEDGFLQIRGRLPADMGAVLVQAIEAVRDELREAEGVSAETPEDPPALGARNADALIHLADSALASAATSTGGDRFQLVVHVDEAALRAEPAESGRCELDGRLPVPYEAARRMACDASLVRIVERDGEPLSVGRKTRAIPPALRRALRSRDGGCQFPGCTQTRHGDAHHLHHWADGGHTDVANLVELCRRHHRLVHEGGFAVEGAPGSLVFVSPSGRRLRPGPRDRRRACSPVPRVSAETCIQPQVETLNLGYAVDALLDFAPPGGGGRGDLAQRAGRPSSLGRDDAPRSP